MRRTIYNLAAAMMAGSLVMGSYGMPVMASEVLEEEVVVAEEAAEMEETAPEEDWSAVDATYPDGISEGDAVPMEAIPMEAEPASDADFDMSTLAGEDTEIVVSAEPSQAAYISNLCSVRLLVLDESGAPVPDVEVSVYHVQNGGISAEVNKVTENFRKYFLDAKGVIERRSDDTGAPFFADVYEYILFMHPEIEPDMTFVTGGDGIVEFTTELPNDPKLDGVYLFKQTGSSADAVLYDEFEAFVVALPDRTGGVTKTDISLSVQMHQPEQHMLVDQDPEAQFLTDTTVTGQETEISGANTLPEEEEEIIKPQAVEHHEEEVTYTKKSVSVPAMLIIALIAIGLAGYGAYYAWKAKQEKDKYSKW